MRRRDTNPSSLHSSAGPEHGPDTREECAPDAARSAAVTESTALAESGATRQRGIALFIMLMIAVILTVVLYKLTFTSKIEQRIADNRRGFLEVSYSMQSVARDVMLRIVNDWKQDLDEAANTEPEDNGTPMGMPPGSTAGEANSSDSSEPVDTRHEEDWAYRFEVQINEIQLDVRVLDAEGRLNLNRIFDYVMVEGEDHEDIDPEAAELEDLESGENSTEDDEGAEDTLFEEDEDWEPPSEEREIQTIEMLTNLVEAVISTNESWDYDYDEYYDSDRIAEEIVDFVLTRQQDPKTRRILRVECLLYLDTVTPELFYGPVDPDAVEEEEDEYEEFQNSSRYTGDYDDGGNYFGEFFEENNDYMEREYVDEIIGPGVDPVPRPIGLRDVLTTYSAVKKDSSASSSGSGPSTGEPGEEELTEELDRGEEGDGESEEASASSSRGREYPALNLNTARYEVLLALISQDYDFEEASEIAADIENYLNSYTEESEESDEPVSGVDDLLGEEELPPPEFNVFRQFDDLKEVNEDWVDGDGSIEESEDSLDASTFTILQKNLKKIAVFRSTYFTAYLSGKLAGHPIEGELVLERYEDEEDSDNREVRVVYWREHLKK